MGRSRNTGNLTVVLYEDPQDKIPKIHVRSSKYMAWIAEMMLPTYLHVDKVSMSISLSEIIGFFRENQSSLTNGEFPIWQNLGFVIFQIYLLLPEEMRVFSEIQRKEKKEVPVVIQERRKKKKEVPVASQMKIRKIHLLMKKYKRVIKNLKEKMINQKVKNNAG